MIVQRKVSAMSFFEKTIISVNIYNQQFVMGLFLNGPHLY